ncbi:MAG: choice-of-anchor L domain-containing protein [Paracoccaceae bacterium]
MAVASELPIDTSATAIDMANAIFGSGVQVLGADYTGAGRASGIFSDGDSVAPGVTPSDTGVILSTGKATSITNSSGDVNKYAYTSGVNRTAGDEDLTEMSGSQTYDAAVLEASFVPQGSELTMQITFSSEEYLEYVGSGFNDAVGIWVNGEPAQLTVGTGDITINNINDESNENLYIDNAAKDDAFNTEMDGFTATLTLKAPVIPGQTNTIKIAVADAGDSYYDSNLMIAGDSVQTALVAHDDEVEISGHHAENVDVLANDFSATNSTLTITEINGTPVSAGDMVTLNSGEEVRLNADGTLSFTGDGDLETNTLSYTVEDEDGNTDVGYIELTTTPCFTAGTRIETDRGLVMVENLKAGDRVRTRDAGFQPLIWCGRSTVRAKDAAAPILIKRGTFGAHKDTSVSPNHRILITSPRAEAWFGTRDVLVPAKFMVNGTSVRHSSTRQTVTYFHLLLEEHHILRGDGLWSESYQPGPETLDTFSPQTKAELDQVLAVSGGHPYRSARRSLRHHEAQLLDLSSAPMPRHPALSPPV